LNKELREIETLKCKKIKATGDIPTLRFGHTSETYKNSMYVFGGWNGYETLGEFFTYSFSKSIEIKIIFKISHSFKYMV